MAYQWCEIRGAQPGPVLGLIGGQHGMEPAGPGILATFLAGEDWRELRGTIRAAPLAFTEALRGGRECAFPAETLAAAERQQVKYGACPWDLNRSTCGRNLNRLWPGQADGSPHERLAHALWQAVCAEADAVIDFHCWMDWAPPGALLYNDAGLALARAFGLPWLHLYPINDPRGILSLTATRLGKAACCIELTPQNRISRDAVQQTRAGLRNVLRHLGMLPGAPAPLAEHYLFRYEPDPRIPLPMPWDGIVVPEAELGAWCPAGTLLAHLVALDDPARVQPLLAPADGLLYNTLERAVVRAGENALGFVRVTRLPGATP
jgi:predicted deacylase